MSASLRTSALVLGLLACLCGPALARRPLGKDGRQPNIVLLLTDDQDAVMGGDWHMPKLRKHLAQEGVNFTSYIANFAVCCPSRTTILTGECAHNSGVVDAWGETLGGFHRFTTLGLEKKTVPVFLQKAGYRTGLIGKYLNQYDTSLVSHVAPGWDRWFAMTSDFGSPDYYDWVASDQGVLKRYGTAEADYSTDVLTEKAVEYIHAYQEDPRPFFLYLTPYATHRPHVPAPRHIGAFKGLKIPRVPSFNESEEHIKKKVSYIRDLPPIDQETADALDYEYQTRAETLLAVDDMIEAVIQALEDVGELDNTYFFYAPDNGFKLGHHRLPGKMSPYENDIRLPFYVRGPGVPKGVHLPHMVGNVDFAATWFELAGVEDPLSVTRDGISMAPILQGNPTVLANPDHHRVGFLIEKPATAGIDDKFVSILTPVRDVTDDVFEGYRPHKLPDGSWPQQVLDWEFQGKDLPAKWAQRVAGDTPFYVTSAFSKSYGMQLYFNMTQKEGLTERGVILGLNEDNPVAYYGLRYQDKHRKYKYIEFPSGYELYDLNTDPHEVDNIFESAPRTLIAALQGQLSLLKVCRGANCHVKSINLLTHAKQETVNADSSDVLQL